MRDFIKIVAAVFFTVLIIFNVYLYTRGATAILTLDNLLWSSFLSILLSFPIVWLIYFLQGKTFITPVSRSIIYPLISCGVIVLYTLIRGGVEGLSTAFWTIIIVILVMTVLGYIVDLFYNKPKKEEKKTI